MRQIVGLRVGALVSVLPALIDSWIIRIHDYNPYYRLLMGGGRTQVLVRVCVHARIHYSNRCPMCYILEHMEVTEGLYGVLWGAVGVIGVRLG